MNGLVDMYSGKICLFLYLKILIEIRFCFLNFGILVKDIG